MEKVCMFRPKYVRSILALGLMLLATSVASADSNDEKKRLGKCNEVLEEILNIPDSIPQELLDKAECVVVIPSVKKFAFGFGGSYGKGAMLCRSGADFTGSWGAPAMYRLEGASIGFQLGGSATDYLLLVMNQKGGYVQLDWFKASEHCFNSYGGRLPSAQEFSIAEAVASWACSKAWLTAATTRSPTISGSSGSSIDGSSETSASLPAPVTTAVTTPPPAVAPKVLPSNSS